MILIQIADVLIVLVQNYMIYNFMYKIWKPRYGYIKSNLLTVFAVALTYVDGAYIVTMTPVFLRVACGIGITGFYGIFGLEGTVIQNIKRTIVYYISLALLELVTIRWFSFPFSLDYHNVAITAELVLARVIYTFLAYFFIMIMQLVINWKKSRDLKLLVIISAILVGFELVILFVLIYAMAGNETRYIVIITAFSCVLVIFGYYLMTEMLYEMIRQQEKKSELEREKLEQKYQYDYYILAREQGEKARDLRHDMRNQLQTVQYLMQAEDEEDKERAEIMLENLRKKIGEIVCEKTEESI